MRGENKMFYGDDGILYEWHDEYDEEGWHVEYEEA
jgi:hypothetical protein